MNIHDVGIHRLGLTKGVLGPLCKFFFFFSPPNCFVGVIVYFHVMWLCVTSCLLLWLVAVFQSKGGSNEVKTKLASEYRTKIEEELKETCEEVLVSIHTHSHVAYNSESDSLFTLQALLDGHLITNSEGESKVFYLKMKGDYHRYLAEGATAQAKIGQCRVSYVVIAVRLTVCFLCVLWSWYMIFTL